MATRWQSAIGPNGTYRITLKGALRRAGTQGPAHDLVFEVRRRDGVWDRECIAESGFNSSLNEFPVAREADDAVWRFKGAIDPDPWVPGGAFEATATFGAAGGSYAGRFAQSEIGGAAEEEFVPKPRPSRGTAARDLRVLAEFEQRGPASRLYDFSMAGYRYGEDPPADPGLPVFRAEDYGVRPDSGEEASDAIQAALDAAGRAGGGIVLLPAGVLDVRVDAWKEPLRIGASRVVLRGAGSGPEGTLVVNHRYADSPEPAKPWLAGQWPVLRVAAAGAQAQPRRLARVTRAERGNAELFVDDASGLSAGRTVRLDHLERTDGGELIRALVGDACRPAANYRGAGKVLVSQLLTVTAVDGLRVRVDLPLHWTLRDAWDAELVAADLLSGAGVEHLRIRTHWDGFFVHHKSPEHDNGWDHVHVSGAEHCWVRDLVSENATTSVSLLDVKNCTVADCRITGNPGHNGYCVGGASTANLLARLDCERPMHAFNLSGRICGNVLHDCRMSEPAGVDLHGGTGLDNLVDRAVGGVLVGGGSDNAVPPRHAPGLTLWNWCHGHYHPYRAVRRVETIARWTETPGFIAVGVHGGDGHRCFYRCRDGQAFADRLADDAWVESNNQAVRPTSLYRYQAARRRSR